MRSVLPVSLLLPLMMLSGGCMSEADRYQWNRTQAHICPSARGLSDSDLDQIAGIVAHAAPLMVAYWIKASGDHKSLRAVTVDVAMPGRAGTCDDHRCYGWCELIKEKGGWRLLKYYDAVSPSLWGGCS